MKPKLFCKTCGKELVRVSGMVCVDGHGRIMPVPDPEPYEPPRLDLPTAMCIRTALVQFRYVAIHTISGLPGEFRRWRRWSVGRGRAERQVETFGEVVKARLCEESVKFVRIEE